MDTDEIGDEIAMNVREVGLSVQEGEARPTFESQADPVPSNTTMINKKDVSGYDLAPDSSTHTLIRPSDDDDVLDSQLATETQVTSTDPAVLADSYSHSQTRQEETVSVNPINTAALDSAKDASTGHQIADNKVPIIGMDHEEALEDYGDEDGGIIRCICECDDDDGFTIQCDRCLVWQHCACFGMSQASVPEEYHCEKCNPRPVDVEFAKLHQQKRRDAEARKASLERSLRRHSQNTTATGAATYHESIAFDTTQAVIEVEGNVAEAQRKGQSSGPGGISRSRKPSQQLDLTNATFVSADGPASATATPGSARSYRKRGGGPKSVSRKTSMAESPAGASLTPRTAAMMSSVGGSTTNTPLTGRADERMDLDETLAEKIEAWQVEYTPSSQNMIVEESVYKSLISVMIDYDQGSPIKAERGTGSRIVAPVVGRKLKLSSSMSATSTNADTEQESSLATVNGIVEFGLTPIGNECIPVEINTSSLAECTQRTYVKQISELASASIFNSLLQMATSPNEPQKPWSASRAFSKPIMHGLFADVSIPAGCFISEYTGEIGNADAYRKDAVNQYQWIGTSKPCVHLFPPPLNLCIDARRYGNTTRFARFSCHPNAVLRPIVSTSMEQEDDSNAKRNSLTRSPSPVYGATKFKSSKIRFGIFALTDISRTHEITLGWEWDDAHIVHLLPQLVRNPMLGLLDPMRSHSKSSSTGNQRLLEREKRHAAIAALVEKGDFPYAGMIFSQKMNSILTVLLSSCLCACIGSASAPSSHGFGGANSSASSNNMKRQDCAISQMLRLSQGMSLLNVHIPGTNTSAKSNRKSKAPDFNPLVGKRRWWRPDAMPLTPTSSADEEKAEVESGRENEYHCKLKVPYKLLPGGKVGRVKESDFENAMEMERIVSYQADQSYADEEDEEGSGEEDGSRDSDASMLTEPLPHGSEGEEDNDDDEEEDDSLLLEGHNVTIAKEEGGASYLIRTALPPKKRVSGTRLKAVNSAEENSDVEYKGRKRRKNKERKEVNQVKEKRGRPKLSQVDEDREVRVFERRTKDADSRMGKRKKRKANEASSPLTSAPSEEEDDSDSDEGSEGSQDNTPTPQQKSRRSSQMAKKMIKREGSNEAEGDGIDAKRRKKIDTEKSKKAMLAKKRRRELLGDLNLESEGSSGIEEERNDIEQEVKERTQLSSTLKKRTKKKGIKKIMESEESGDSAEKGQSREAEDSLQAAPLALTVESLPEVVPSPPPPPVVVPPTIIEVPKAKLSLAEYKKRLAERRTTSKNNQSNQSTPLSTPGIVFTEKMSLPSTPSSASAMQSGFTFPTSTSAPALDLITTPSIIKTEFAPPTPRFPRPMTPPRVAPVPAPRSVSAGALLTSDSMSSFASRAEFDNSSLSSTTLYPPRPSLAGSDSLPVAPTQSTVEPEKSSSLSATPVTISSVAPLQQQQQQTIQSPTEKTQPVQLETDSNTATAPLVESIVPQTESQSSLEPATQSSTSVDTFASPSKPFAGRQGKSFGSLPTTTTMTTTQSAAIAAAAAVAASFNPPKAPRALINSTYPAPGVTSAPVSATSPPVNPVRSNIGTTTVHGTIAPGDTRHQRQTSSYQDATASPPALPLRNPSPTRQPSLVSPSTTIGSPYTSTSVSVSNPGATTLNDFANVPKGPARMREREREFRERERERDRVDERPFREPLPPPRDWDRERDWERERERDYVDRDPIYHRDRSHSFDRRRMEEEDDRIDFAPTRSVPPFVPRGGGVIGGRGGFPNRGVALWAGRARTRGRGSRGAGWR